MAIFYILIGTFLFLNGVMMPFMANFNLGVVFTVALGIFFLLCGVYRDRIKAITKAGIWKVIKYIILFCIVAEIVLIGFMTAFGLNDNVTCKEDAVIVLGAGIHGNTVSLPLAMRLDKALEYHKKNPEAVIVVTGGKGYQENISEAEAMKKYLIARGVAADRIIKEEQATSTNENLLFSKKILDKKLGQKYTVVIITNNFHVYRGATVAKNNGFYNVSHLHATLQWYNLAPCYLRESVAILKMWVLG